MLPLRATQEGRAMGWFGMSLAQLSPRGGR
jgi:hypothetical protein